MTSISSSSLASGHLPDLAQLLSSETVDEPPKIFSWQEQEDQLDAAAASPLHAFNVPRSIPPPPPPLPPQPLYQLPVPPHPLTNLSYSNRNQIPTNETHQFVHSYSSVAPQNIPPSPQDIVLVARTIDWHHVHSVLETSTRTRWSEERGICKAYRLDEQRLRATGRDIALKKQEQAKFSKLESCHVRYRAIESDLRQKYGHPLVENVLNSIESELASQREAPFRGETQQLRLLLPPPLPPPPHLLTNPPHSDSHQTHQCVPPSSIVAFQNTSPQDTVLVARTPEWQHVYSFLKSSTQLRLQEEQEICEQHCPTARALQKLNKMTGPQRDIALKKLEQDKSSHLELCRGKYRNLETRLTREYGPDLVGEVLNSIKSELASQREAQLREETQPPHSANASMPATTTSSKRSHSISSDEHHAVLSLCALQQALDPVEPSAKRPQKKS